MKQMRNRDSQSSTRCLEFVDLPIRLYRCVGASQIPPNPPKIASTNSTLLSGEARPVGCLPVTDTTVVVCRGKLKRGNGLQTLFNNNSTLSPGKPMYSIIEFALFTEGFSAIYEQCCSVIILMIIFKKHLLMSKYRPYVVMNLNWHGKRLILLAIDPLKTTP